MTEVRITPTPLVSLRDFIDKEMEKVLVEGIKLCEPLIQYESNVLKALKLEYSLRKLKVPSIKQWQARLNEKAKVVAELLKPLNLHDIVLKWRPIYKPIDDSPWGSYKLMKEFVNDCLNANEEEAFVYNLMMSECVLLGNHRKEVFDALADWPLNCLLTSYAVEFTCSQCDDVWQYEHKGKTRPSFGQLYCPHCGMTASEKKAFLKGDIRKLSFVDPSIMYERLKSLCTLVEELTSSYHKDELYLYQGDLDKHVAESHLPLTSEEEQLLNEIIRLGEHVFSPYCGEYYRYSEHSAFTSLIEKKALIPVFAINPYEYIQMLVTATISFSWLDDRGRNNKIETGHLTLAMENKARRFVGCKLDIKGNDSIDSRFIFEKVLMIHPAFNSQTNPLPLENLKPKVNFLFDPIPESFARHDSMDEHSYIYRIDWEFKGDKCAYIGKRKSKVPPEQDAYMGSGALLKVAKKLATLHSANCIFRKTVLKILPISADPLWYEQLAIDELKDLEPEVCCYNDINPHGALAKAMRELKEKL